MNNELVNVIINGVPYKAERGVLLSSLPPFREEMEMPCGGRGDCGKCLVRVKGQAAPPTAREISLLGEEKLSRGIRLACMCSVQGDLEAEFEKKGNSRITLSTVMPDFEINSDFRRYALAVDLGSTTVVGALCTGDGVLISVRGRENPQRAYGADVISRMEKAVNGCSKELARITVKAIEELALLLAGDAGIKANEIELAVITGNTAMLSLLTQTDTEAMCKAPFRANRLFGEYVSTEVLGFENICKGTRIYLPSCISAFVGADTVCALLCSQLCESGESGMLTDIGTNGETALWHKGELSVCSSAAGPAFEGAGISCGMWSREGAIDKVSLVNEVLYPHVIGEGRALGICGAGAVDALACLMDTDELDEAGHLENGEAFLAPNISITQKDVHELTLAKAAIRAGIEILLDKKQIGIQDLDAFYICGGFGSNLNIHNAEKMGLLPKGTNKIASVLGNAALGGAIMMLMNEKYRTQGREMAEKAVHISLSGDNSFFERYVENMFYIRR